MAHLGLGDSRSSKDGLVCFGPGRLKGQINVEPIQTVNSSVVFGGTGHSLFVYEDSLVAYVPHQQGPDFIGLRYAQIARLYLHTGMFYVTLTLGTFEGYSLMLRWLPKDRAIRAAEFIRERMPSTQVGPV